MAISLKSDTIKMKSKLPTVDDLTDYTRSRSLTAFPGGLAITIMKRLIVIGAKIALFEFLHQLLFF
jgi:hypothetical protein